METALGKTTACQERLACVLAYIEDHLDQPLSLAAVASHCHISPFHFHRLFHSAVNETLGKHVRRMRLEKAARNLLYTDEPVEKIASAVGYESAAVLHRAFKNRYGCSPVAFRTWARAALDAELQVIDKADRTKARQIPSRFEFVPERRLAYIRRVGSYSSSVDEARSALEKQPQLANVLKNIGERIAIAHDTPLVTAEESLRYDACIPIPDHVVAHGELGIRHQKAGRYAVFTHRGPEQDLWRTCAAIYRQWRASSPDGLAAAPAFASCARTSKSDVIRGCRATRHRAVAPAERCRLATWGGTLGNPQHDAFSVLDRRFAHLYRLASCDRCAQRTAS